MTAVSPAILVQPEAWSKKAWRTIRSFARAKPLGMAAAIVFIIMIIVAIVGPWITPYDPLETNVRARLLAPSWEHLAGTDNLGRDVFSRLIDGTRIAILIGVTASFIGSTIGVLVGVISGYLGGKFDLYFQRVMDMIMAFPYLILAIAIMAVLGGSIQNVIFAIAFPMIPTGNRIARSIAISVREAAFIEAARSLGAKQVRIIFRHVLPNAIAAYLIVLTAALGASILSEASLSFLGLGVPPPHPSWGRALNEAMSYFYNAPWLAIFPGVAISLAVFSANLFGDALRDIWDPRLKRV
jgi:peptide/nickel transport system permease protein